MKFSLTNLLLNFWARVDNDTWAHEETITLIRCIYARTEYKAITGLEELLGEHNVNETIY